MPALRWTAAFILCLMGATALSEDSQEMVASSAGFRPRQIKARKGETIRLSLRSADGEHCFAVDELRIEKRIRPGRPSTAEITADRAGKLEFYCCLDPERERGEILITD